MSEKNLEQTDKDKERSYWQNPKHMMIYNLFIDGKTIMEIADITKARSPIDVENTITNKYFMRRLESHVRGVDFTFKINKVLATYNVFNILWNKVKDNINDMSPEVCLRELTKFLPSDKKELIAQLFIDGAEVKVKKEDKDYIDAEFGYVGLQEGKNDKYPELEQNDKSDKQRDTGVDNKEQDTNE